MNKITALLAISLALILVATLTPSRAATPDEAFQQANDAYTASDFTDAITAYETIANDGNHSADLYYNLANTYHRAGETGMALLNYQRALALRPSHPEARLNAEFLRRDIAAIPTERTLMQRWFGGHNSDQLTIVASTAAWVMVLALILIVLRRPTALRLLAMVAGLFTTAYCVTGLLARDDGRLDPDLALVVKSETKAFYSPSSTGESVSPVPIGTKVDLLTQSGAWTYIQLPDQRRGWIPTDTAERIVPTASVVSTD